MTNNEKSEIRDSLEFAVRRKAIQREVQFWVSIAVLILFSLGFFMWTTVAITNQHAEESKKAYDKASHAEDQLRGNRGMIIAVCLALRRRDINETAKWKSVTDVEFHYPRPNRNAIDEAYHAARRRVLEKSHLEDEKLLNLNCMQDMKAAYQKAMSK